MQSRSAHHVPEGGMVWVQNVMLPFAGPEYKYVTPPLRRYQLYSYEVRATWTEDGRSVTETRTATVQSGEKHVIGFTK